MRLTDNTCRAVLTATAIALTLAAGPGRATAQSRRPTPPAKSAAVQSPSVSVAGIQIVSAKVSDDDWGAKPFHANNGTSLVLLIRMPPGMGLLDIDEDNSTLETFTDDKDTDLQGKFESFPSEFKDGTGGTLAVQSVYVPSDGATTLSAGGVVVLQTAGGSKVQKVSNIRLENDKTFKVGTTVITLADVAADGDAQTFTLKLPRVVMKGIRSVRFLDAKGKEIESSRTSSGYINDDAEMGFKLTTALKAVTAEFDTWQNLREVKVPFTVKTGLALR